MKDPVKRLKQTIAVAAVLLLLYSAAMLYMESRQYKAMIMKESGCQIRSGTVLSPENVLRAAVWWSG